MGLRAGVRTVSLFTGGGGLDLGTGQAIARLGGTLEPLVYVEREAFAVACLVSHFEQGSMALGAIHTDVRTIDLRKLRGSVDLLLGGYPCQPWSTAGKRLGFADERDLWPHVARIVSDCAPQWVFVENVAAHLGHGFERTVGDLEKLHYRVEAGIYAAAEIGAPQRRERLFALARAEGTLGRPQFQPRGSRRRRSGSAGNGETLAHAPSRRFGKEWADQREPEKRASGPIADVANAGGSRFERPQWPGPSFARLVASDSTGEFRRLPFPPGPAGDWSGVPAEYWPLEFDVGPDDQVEPAVRGVADGLAHRLDRSRTADLRTHRLRMLGNGVVPAQAEFAFLDLWRRHGG